MSLVQITKREGRIERVPDGRTPVLELSLGDRAYVAAAEIKPIMLFNSERKTVDWTWTAYIVTPLDAAG